ncbi:MAG: DNA helicase RecG, partial [Acidaminococcaceae bacterium]|nr:DNA helicase RecG [Acidaminococcaceae bacterium]
MENWWQKPVTSLKGIGSKRAEAFSRLGIETIGDLLNFYPRLDSYIDYSHLATIRELKTDGSRQIFEAEAMRAVERYSGGGRRYAVITVKDETGYAEIFLFGAQRFQARRFKPGSRILVTGRVKPGRGVAKAVSEVLLQPCDEYSLDRSVGILPVYNLTES